ncbi:peptide ABC transporter substrate-binding protein [Paratissierella segnis]|uniref:Peptide ABC transporter substrate-binding protein n=1 Tax=Paratissierella segnis TaxID=2763679 RepID=A0A926IL04_9FIRM|nr:peptide ABC transporter substrate-binding protein [Paratissierella segnis]MBC8588855.1 peptide ABC transporter substrate-binding protein [Paratissierella segnis]
MKSKRITILLIICLISSFITSCDYDNDKEVVDIDNKQEELNYLITGSGQVILPLTNFSTLNPLITENVYYFYFSKLIFEGLFDFDENLKPVPQLASAYTIDNEGKKVSIKLNDNVYWHDGEKFTSEDVLFTINTLKYADNNTIYKKMISDSVGLIGTQDVNKIIDVKVIDEYNLDIFFSGGFSNSLEILTFPIIAKHIFDNKNKNQGYKNALDMDNYIPIGTGPFKYESYDKFKSITLKAYDNYREGKPGIDTVVGKVLEDEELILTSFETGQISLAKASGVDWDKYKNNNRINVIEYLSNNYEFLGFNFDKEVFSNDKGLEIRKAIYYGINRQDIISKVLLGHGTQIDVPIHPQSWLISNVANYYGYNSELAKKILNSAGFRDIDGDNILEGEDGNKLSFRLTTNSFNPYRTKMAEMIKDDLKEIGINIVLDFDTSYMDNITEEMRTNEVDRIANILDSGNFDIVLTGWQMSVIPELSFLYMSDASKLSNFSRYKNETMDNLLIEANMSFDREGKVAQYEKLQKYVIEDIPNISLFFDNSAILVDSSIVGDLTPSFFNLYKGLERCVLTTSAE